MLGSPRRRLLLQMAVQVRCETELAVAEQLRDFSELNPLSNQELARRQKMANEMW